MSIHTVIESLAAYEAVRAQDPKGERVWWTTSPYLLVNLPQRGETVRSPEEDLPQAEFDGLAKAGYVFAETFSRAMNRLCPWRDFVDLEKVFAQTLNSLFFVTMYKGLLLQRVFVAAREGEPVVCAGDPELGDPSGYSPLYGRFDTLYAALARRMDGAMVDVFAFRADADALQRLDHEVRFRRIGFAERQMSLLCNTASSFLFKMWRRIRGLSRGLLKRVTLLPGTWRRVYLYHDCEMIEDAFLSLLAAGCSVEYLSPIARRRDAAGQLLPLLDADALREACREAVADAAKTTSAQGMEAFPACVDLIWNRMEPCLRRFHADFLDLLQSFSTTCSRMSRRGVLLTNFLTAPEERLFLAYCRYRGVRVCTVEHGITLGLSDWTELSAKYYAMSQGDVGVYHQAAAAEAMAPYAADQVRLVAGVPAVTASPFAPRLQRVLARRFLGVEQKRHMVMYVADLARNNFMYGPASDNDHQYLVKTRKIVRELARSFPNSLVYLKLYPSVRYLDDYDFSDLLEEFPNLRIVKNVEFRFIRCSADFLVSTSTQSTLGWVAGAGATAVLLECPWAPARVGGLGFAASMDGMACRAVFLDAPSLLTPFDASFIRRIFPDEIHEGEFH